jgi:hypothetical protein
MRGERVPFWAYLYHNGWGDSRHDSGSLSRNSCAHRSTELLELESRLFFGGVTRKSRDTNGKSCDAVSPSCAPPPPRMYATCITRALTRQPVNPQPARQMSTRNPPGTFFSFGLIRVGASVRVTSSSV